MNSNYVVVPARGGSKGISNKNLRVIGGRELVIRSIIHAKELVPNENIILRKCLKLKVKTNLTGIILVIILPSPSYTSA